MQRVSVSSVVYVYTYDRKYLYIPRRSQAYLDKSFSGVVSISLATIVIEILPSEGSPKLPGRALVFPRWVHSENSPYLPGTALMTQVSSMSTPFHSGNSPYLPGMTLQC